MAPLPIEWSLFCAIPRRHATHPPHVQYIYSVPSAILQIPPVLSCSPTRSHPALLRHLRIHLLEPLAQPLRALERLVHAAHDTALLLTQQCLGCEVGHAVGEASLDEVGVHLQQNTRLIGKGRSARLMRLESYGHEVLHLLPLHAALQLALLCLVEPARSVSWLFWIGRSRDLGDVHIHAGHVGLACDRGVLVVTG